MRGSLFTVIVLVAFLAVGIGAGALITHSKMNGRMNEYDIKLAEAADKMKVAQQEAADLHAQVDALKAELKNRDEFEKTMRTAAPDSPPQDMELTGEAAMEPPSDMPAPDAATEGRDRRRGPREDGEDGDADSRRERMREFQEEARNRMDTFFQDQIAAATTAESQQRLAAIQENMNYMNELREAMRQAQTDEERQALQETMMQTGQNLRQLMQEQQDATLREKATQLGITDAAKQDEFISAVREVQSNPMSGMGGMMGGRGGFGGGPGGGGPGGGGPGGR